MALLLYSFAPQDRSGKIRWLLEELEVPYEIRTLRGEEGEHKGDFYTSISPMGLVPALQDGDVSLFESSAIAIYLCEKFAEQKCLAPGPGSVHRGDFLKWVSFASTSLDPLLIKVFETKGLTEQEREDHLKAIDAEFKPVANFLEKTLGDSRFIVTGEFSAADIMLAQPLDWAKSGGLLKSHPILENYLELLKQRPACIRSSVFQG